MEVLLYKDVILNYISHKITNADHRRLIRKILENDNSKFLYSKQFFELIKKDLPSEYETEFFALVTKFNDYGKNIKSSQASTNFDEEILSIYDNSTENLSICIAYSKPDSKILNHIPNIAILSECEKPNYHWLVTQLAVNHPNKVTVKWSDFKDNNQIQQFFNDIFKIPKRISRVNIFDRYKRFAHTKFNSFKDTCNVSYFTLYIRSEYFQDEILIKRHFRKVRIHTTANKDIAHGRRIVFENILVKTDNSFENLDLPGDWDIDIQISPADVADWMSICRNFREQR